MWWSIVFIVIITVIVALAFLARKLSSDRKRYASWNNLHERGKMISAQLADMRDAADRRDGLESTVKAPDAPAPAESPKLFWPKQIIQFRSAGTALFANSPMNRHVDQII